MSGNGRDREEQLWQTLMILVLTGKENVSSVKTMLRCAMEMKTSDDGSSRSRSRSRSRSEDGDDDGDAKNARVKSVLSTRSYNVIMKGLTHLICQPQPVPRERGGQKQGTKKEDKGGLASFRYAQSEEERLLVYESICLLFKNANVDGDSAKRQAQGESIDTNACFVSELRAGKDTVALGHLISTLMDSIDKEVTAGSRRNIVAAFTTLSNLIKTVAGVVAGAAQRTKAARDSFTDSCSDDWALCSTWRSADADVLAFFLPGVASGIAKFLARACDIGSETMNVKSAAGYGKCVDAALETLCMLLMATMGDSFDSGDGKREERSSNQVQRNVDIAKGQPHLKVDRNDVWKKKGDSQLVLLYAVILKAICRHSNHKARLSLLNFATSCVENCSSNLPSFVELCIESILSLKTDQTTIVSKEAEADISRLLDADLIDSKKLERKLEQLLNDIPKQCLEAGSPQMGALHCRLTYAVMTSLGPTRCGHILCDSYASCQHLWRIFSQCITFDMRDGCSGLTKSNGSGGGAGIGPNGVLIHKEQGTSKETKKCKSQSHESKYDRIIEKAPCDEDEHVASNWDVMSGTPRAEVIKSWANSKAMREDSNNDTSGSSNSEKLANRDQRIPMLPHEHNMVLDMEVYKCLALIVRYTGQSAYTIRATDSLLRSFLSIFDLLMASLLDNDTSEVVIESMRKSYQAASAIFYVIPEILYGYVCARENDQNRDTRTNPNEIVEAVVRNISQCKFWNEIDKTNVNQKVRDSRNAIYRELVIVAALQACGNLSVLVGRSFRRRSLFTVLIPVLTCLGDTSNIVSSAAATTISKFCEAVEYENLTSLVEDNADHIIDSMCSQLRQLENNPRSPHLFSALLDRGGATKALLPLLREPLQLTVKSLSVTGRYKYAIHIKSFVKIIFTIASAVKREMREARTSLATHASNSLLPFHHHTLYSRDVLDPNAHKTLWEEVSEGHCSFDVDDVVMYITRTAEKEETISEINNVKLSTHTDLDGIKRSIVAGSQLAEAVFKAALPLVSQKEIGVAVTVYKTIGEALRAIGETERCGGLMKFHTEMLQNKIVRKSLDESSIDTEPVDDVPQGAVDCEDVPRVLPCVHKAWSIFLEGLRHSRRPVILAALDLLQHIVTASGGKFVSDRMKRQGWPLLHKIYKDGPTDRTSISSMPGSSKRNLFEEDEFVQGMDDNSAASVLDIKLNILNCLKVLSNCSSGVRGLKSAARDIITCISKIPTFHNGKEDIQLKCALIKILKSMANVDADASWYALLIHTKVQ